MLSDLQNSLLFPLLASLLGALLGIGVPVLAVYVYLKYVDRAARSHLGRSALTEVKDVQPVNAHSQATIDKLIAERDAAVAALRYAERQFSEYEQVLQDRLSRAQAKIGELRKKVAK